MELKRLAKKAMASLFLSMLCLAAFAQVRTVTGVVVDTQGEPMIGVNVLVKGTANGSITDFDGKFSISGVSDNSVIVVSYIGYLPEQVTVGKQTSIKITLKEDAEQLDEVVVIGYQTVRRKDLTGSVASVKGSTLAATPVTNVAQALQGKLPGVNVMSQDGRPNASVSIRVRGGGSISQNNDPLVLIDGIPGTIGDIPGDQVESIDVLKDASSTAIYGARGANGVILVTTKKGKEGKVSVNYSGYAKFNTTTGYMETLNPYDYLAYKWGVLAAYDGETATTPFQQLFGIGDYTTDKNKAGINGYKNVSVYDMQKEVYNSSFSHNHDLTITGGSDRTKVIFSLNYMDEQGMKLQSYNKRASASFKLEQKISNNLTFNLDARYTDRTTLGSEGTTNGYGSVLSGAYRFRPISVADIDARGDIKVFDNTKLGEENNVMFDVTNGVNRIKNNDEREMTQSYRATAGINWNIIKGLAYRTELTLTRGYTTNKTWNGPLVSDNYYTAIGTKETIDEIKYAGNADYRKRDKWSSRWSNTLNYQFELKQAHRINVLVGQEVTDSGGSDLRVQAEMYPANFTKDNAFAMISQYGDKLSLSSGVTTPSRILSYFGRANYSLLDRYMLTVTMRADGSSNFSPEHRWGYFPAAALAWRISEEAFMKPLTWLDDLKLRFSYGQVGNDAINSDQWTQMWEAETDIKFQYGLGNKSQPAYDLASKQMANRDLKWETTITRNIGLDFTLLKNRMWGSIEVYKNTTKDLLMLTDIPSITGFNNTYANIGQTSNKGLELSLSGVLYKNQDWNITGGVNINFNKGNIDKLAEGVQSAYGTQFLQSGIPNTDYVLKEGKPVGIVQGYKMDGKGYYTTQDFDYDSTTGIYTLKPGIADLTGAFVGQHGGKVPAGQYAYPGMPKFQNMNDDNIITEADIVEIGNMNPKHTGGFNVNVNYKNFDLGLYFNWSYGNDIYNANRLATLYNGEKGGGLYGNKLAITNNCYKIYDIKDGMLMPLTTPEQLDAANKNATLPLTYLKQGYVSDIGIEDGSYLRLNTLTLGYTLPKTILKKVGMNNIRVYGTIYNVFTLTGYSGLDPEVNTQSNMNNSRYPTPGLDWGTYPRARQFVLGVNATF